MHIHMFEGASVDCGMVLVANMGENKGLLKTRPPTPLVFMFKDEPANYVMEAIRVTKIDRGLLKTYQPPPLVSPGSPWMGSSMSLGGGRFFSALMSL